MVRNSQMRPNRLVHRSNSLTLHHFFKVMMRHCSLVSELPLDVESVPVGSEVCTLFADRVEGYDAALAAAQRASRWSWSRRALYCV